MTGVFIHAERSSRTTRFLQRKEERDESDACRRRDGCVLSARFAGFRICAPWLQRGVRRNQVHGSEGNSLECPLGKPARISSDGRHGCQRQDGVVAPRNDYAERPQTEWHHEAGFHLEYGEAHERTGLPREGWR